MKKLKLDLMMFEGEGASAGTSADTGVSGAESQVAAEPTRKSRKQNPLANVKYGKDAETQVQTDTVPTEGNSQEDTSTASEELTFDKLVKDPKYKADHDAYMQKAFDKRMAEIRQNERNLQGKLNQVDPLIQRLASRYGKDVTDMEGILSAFDSDSELLQNEAMERGLTIEQLAEVKRIERRNMTLEQQQREIEQKANAEKIYQGWLAEAEQVKELYPNFDFRASMENPDFVDLLKKGMSVDAANKVVNFDNIMGSIAAKSVEVAKAKTINGIQSKSLRPAENGNNSQAAVVTKKSAKELSKADRAEIERRVMKGEIIGF